MKLREYIFHWHLDRIHDIVVLAKDEAQAYRKAKRAGASFAECESCGSPLWELDWECQDDERDEVE